MQLAGQAVVVAGAARGIGRAIAEAFVAEGAKVAFLDRDDSVGEAARATDASGAGSLSITADVTDYPAMQRAARQTRDWAGRLDHVVFAVAIPSGKYGFPFWNLEPGDWSRVLHVNVIGAVNVAHAFAPALIEARAGSLLFLASVAGQIGSQTDPPYSASKAALINFAQCAAKDLAPFNVRVNSLCPGMVRTPLNRSIWEAWSRTQPAERQQSFEDWATEKIERVVPLRRWQEPADIAALAVFLASARGANITGQTMNVDGGFVMHW